MVIMFFLNLLPLLILFFLLLPVLFLSTLSSSSPFPFFLSPRPFLFSLSPSLLPSPLPSFLLFFLLLPSHLPIVMYFVVSFTAPLEHTSKRVLPLSHLSLSVCFIAQIVQFSVASEPFNFQI